MKLSTANLIGAFATIGLWAIFLMLSMFPITNVIALAIIGFVIISLWMINAIGSIIGLVVVIREVDSVEAWFSFGAHFLQFSVITLLTIIGVASGI
jgi:hypothetical protein